MKYIVVWTIIVWVATGCPDYKPDPYTGQYPSTHCLVNHGKFEEKKMEKEFSTKEEALKFIEDAPKNIKLIMQILRVSSK